MKHRVIGVTEFKAKCLALLEEIGEHGGSLTVTKRGKPLATVGPAKRTARRSMEGAWIGKIELPEAVFDQETTLDWNVMKAGWGDGE